MPLSCTFGNTPSRDTFTHSLHSTAESAPTAGMSQQHWLPTHEPTLVDQQYERAWTGQDFRGPIMRDVMQGATPQQSLKIHARPQRQMDHASDPTRIRAAALRNRQRHYPRQDKRGRSEASSYILASVSWGGLPASTGTKRGPVVDHTQGDDAEANRPSKRVVTENSFAQFAAHEGRWRPGTHMPACRFDSSPLPFGTTPHTPSDQLSQPYRGAALHAAPQRPDMTTYLSGGLHAYSRQSGHPLHRPAPTVSSVASRKLIDSKTIPPPWRKMRIRRDHFPYIEDADWAHLNRMYVGSDDAKLRAQKRKEWNARAKSEYEERWLAKRTLEDTTVKLVLPRSADKRQRDAGMEDIPVSMAEERGIGRKAKGPARLDARAALSSPSEQNVGKPMPTVAYQEPEGEWKEILQASDMDIRVVHRFWQSADEIVNRSTNPYTVRTSAEVSTLSSRRSR